MTTGAERTRHVRTGAVLLAGLAAVGLGACATARDDAALDPPRLGPEKAFAVANGYAGGYLEYRRREWASAAESYQSAYSFNPLDDSAAYLAAAAWARAGRAPAALEFLTEVWHLNSCLVPLPRSFLSIAGEPRLKDLEELIAAQVTRTHRSTAAFTLAERDLLPGGLAWDPVGKAYYVPSIRKRKIVRVAPPAPSGRAEAADFAADGLDAVLAVKVDAARRRLWAVTGVDPAMAGFRPADFGRSALVAYDLETGKAAGRFLPATDPPHLFGDLALDDAGDVFVTDTVSGEVHVLRAGATALAALVPAKTFVAPKGIAVSPDGTRLYVSDLARGVYRVDPRTGEAAILDQPRGPWPIALEGLVLHGDDLVGVTATVSHGRVGRWTLTPDGRAVRRIEILDCGHPAYHVPAGGSLAGDDYVYVANSQLDDVAEDGTLPPLEKLGEPVVLRLRLPH